MTSTLAHRKCQVIFFNTERDEIWYSASFWILHFYFPPLELVHRVLRWKISNLISNEYLSLTHFKLCKEDIQGRLEKTKIISHFLRSVLSNWFISISYTLSTKYICSFKSGVFRFKKFTGGYTESRKNGHCTLLDRKGKRYKDQNMDQL